MSIVRHYLRASLLAAIWAKQHFIAALPCRIGRMSRQCRVTFAAINLNAVASNTACSFQLPPKTQYIATLFTHPPRAPLSARGVLQPPRRSLFHKRRPHRVFFVDAFDPRSSALTLGGDAH
ncbi:hypothetical protein BKA63DRAFT_48522 [Paraphoma chrysanthemicola]|nr:hypothetical protein BKA63DRAFT_48522 [Paraphoma chrysanthemicola]